MIEFRDKTATELQLERLRRMGIEPAADPSVALDELRRDAFSVAKRMEAIHGGDWRVLIDHEHAFVSILQR